MIEKTLDHADDPALEALRKRKAEITARIRELEIKRAANSRKDRNRQAILIGIAFLADVTRNPDLRHTIDATLDRAITNPKDRTFLASKGYPLSDDQANTPHQVEGNDRPKFHRQVKAGH